MKTLSVVYVSMILTVAGQAWFTNYARSQETIAPLVVDADGKPLCGEWLEMLRGNRSETVVFTGSDKHGQKVKVLVDGQKWRFVILAGAADPRFGCEIMAGDGFSSR